MEQTIVGEVTITSGKIAAGDPQCCPDNVFTQSVPPGAYPVVIYRDRKGAFGDVQMAVLTLSDHPVYSWEEAVFESGPYKGVSSYGVDTGTGCFVDASIASTLEHNEELSDYVCEGMENHQLWHNWQADDIHNAIIFQTGVGDGEYKSYVGLDKEGGVVCIVTDFEIMEVRDRERYFPGMPMPDGFYDDEDDEEDEEEEDEE